MVTRVYGLDFTSAPRKRKPITCVQCTFDGSMLHLDKYYEFEDFEEFIRFLSQPGPWIAGIDFPFGQPRILIEEKGWGDTWEECVGAIAGMKNKSDFGEELKKYRDGHDQGQKQPLRRTDACANSRSPMMWKGVPVGMMFFEGAPRLLRSGVQVIPCRMNNDDRIVVEAYPKLVAQKWTDELPKKERSYKSDTKSKQTAVRKSARQTIVTGLRAKCATHYGFDVDVSEKFAAQCIEDASGDQLDALLSAVQAAWASAQPNYGIPADCDRLEGWIVDPATITSWKKSRCQGKQ